MSDWLDLMLEEINRKKQEADDAAAESARRSGEAKQATGSTDKKSENSQT